LTLRQQHLKWCVSLAQEAEPHLEGQDQKRWLDRLEAEHDNFRKALGWSLEAHTVASAVEAGQVLAAALWRFWYVRGYLTEGRQWSEAALESSTRGTPGLRALLLARAGLLANDQGDYDQAPTF
jgi:predicted ATPase